VRQSVRQLHFAGSDSQIEKRPYILGIQTLCKARPWMTMFDVELFLQGWFHAEAALGRNVDIESGIEFDPVDASVSQAAVSNSATLQT
jgi:hypothetical protein